MERFDVGLEVECSRWVLDKQAVIDLHEGLSKRHDSSSFHCDCEIRDSNVEIVTGQHPDHAGPQPIGLNSAPLAIRRLSQRKRKIRDRLQK